MDSIDDTENIDNYRFLKRFIKEDDKLNIENVRYHIVLFRSVHSKPLKPIYWDLLFNNNIEIETVNIVEGRKESMDMQIATYAGTLINNSYLNKIFIVSNDLGFKTTILFLNKIKNIIKEILPCKILLSDKALYEISKKFDINESKLKEVCCNFESFHDLHNRLRQKYANREYLNIYNEIKTKLA